MLGAVRTLLVFALLAAAAPASAKPKVKPLLEAFNEGKSADRRRLAVPLGRTRDEVRELLRETWTRRPGH